MQDFLNDANSVYWWLSVVLVGIVLNLVSAFLQRRLDHQLSRASSWWRKRSEQQRQDDNKIIGRLRARPDLFAWHLTRSILAGFAVLTALLGTCTFLILGTVITFIGPAPSTTDFSTNMLATLFLATSVLFVLPGMIAMTYLRKEAHRIREALHQEPSNTMADPPDQGQNKPG